MHAVAYHWAIPNLQYVVIGPEGRVRSVEPIEVADGPMVHDCSITERWLVVYDLPVTFDIETAMSGARFPYRWNDAHPARIGLVPLGGSGAEVRWFDVAPCYVFHPLNAWDDGDRVVLDVVRYPKMFDERPLGPDDGAPTLWRWTIDTVGGTVLEEQLSDIAMEFPRVDERRVGRSSTWGYASAVRDVDDHNDFGGDLLRIDQRTGDVQRIGMGAGRLSGEWVMVPRHADAAEDDGWLMTYVYDGDSARSELVVLAADAPDAGPVARVLLPAKVPMGFHGNWISTSA